MEENYVVDLVRDRAFHRQHHRHSDCFSMRHCVFQVQPISNMIEFDRHIPYLEYYLNGKRPSIEFSLRYAKLLGMSLDKFYKYLEG